MSGVRFGQLSVCRPMDTTEANHYAVLEDLPGTSKIMRRLTKKASKVYPEARLTVLATEEEKCWTNPHMSTPAGCCGWSL